MKLSEFRIRDPFILLDGDTYYLYGTTRLADNGVTDVTFGFDVFVSRDLENFDGPYEVFSPGDDFWGIRDFWAPEVYKYRGAYYMFATFKDAGRLHGVGILRSESPMGPFLPHSEIPLTSRSWSSLDGTLYISEEGKPYMIFCHEWSQLIDGEMCYAELSDDLTRFVTEPVTMFSAKPSPFVYPSKLWGTTDGYITDGPYMYRSSTGELLMLWSSKGADGYMECVYRADNGRLDGKFVPESLLYTEDGGHGMIFKDKDGRLLFVLHTPNVIGEERATIFELCDKGNTLTIARRL